MRKCIIPIFVPHKGCPNDCVFCNQKKIASAIVDITPNDVDDTIQKYLRTIPQDSYIEVAFYGGSFTGIDIEYQKQLLEVANKYKIANKIKGIRLSTRPDYIDKTILDNLKFYGVTEIELGVQSMNDKILEMNRRGHKAIDVVHAVNLIREYDFKLGLQMMPGLYMSSSEDDINTAVEIEKLKPDFVRIYPTLVVKDTFLEVLYLNGAYKPLELNKAVLVSKEILRIFERSNIGVIRVGLQATDNMQMGKDVVAGPFHAAFRELVENEVYWDMLQYGMEKLQIENISALNINVNPKDVSKLVGNKKSNIKRLKEKYNVKELFINQDNNILSNSVKLSVKNRTIVIDKKDWYNF